MSAWSASGWERDRRRREIAELEELARWLLELYGARRRPTH